jgi:hypothetical protein
MAQTTAGPDGENDDQVEKKNAEQEPGKETPDHYATYGEF